MRIESPDERSQWQWWAARRAGMVEHGRRLGLRVALADVLPWNNGDARAANDIVWLNILVSAIAEGTERAAAAVSRHAGGSGAPRTHVRRLDGRRRPSVDRRTPPARRARVPPARGTLDGDELVADAAHGDDTGGIAGVGLELPPQVRDVHVDRPPVAGNVAAPEMAHELFACEDLPGHGGEMRHEAELRACERHRPSVDRRGVPGDVEVEPAHALHDGAAGPVELAPAQERTHATDELGDRERLRQIVVGADLEPRDAVELGVAGGQHDDRQVALGAERPADVEPRQSGQ